MHFAKYRVPRVAQTNLDFDLDFAFTGLLADLKHIVSTLSRVSDNPLNLRAAPIFDTTISDDHTRVMGASRPCFNSRAY